MKTKNKKIKYRDIVISLVNTKILILIVIIMIIFFYISYMSKDSWISEVLLSLGTGMFTSLLFYFLANMRVNKMNKLISEINSLKYITGHFDNLYNLKIQIKNKDYIRKNINLESFISIVKHDTYGVYLHIKMLPKKLLKAINGNDIEKLETLEKVDSVTSWEELWDYIDDFQNQIMHIRYKINLEMNKRKLQITVLKNECF